MVLVRALLRRWGVVVAFLLSPSIALPALGPPRELLTVVPAAALAVVGIVGPPSSVRPSVQRVSSLSLRVAVFLAPLLGALVTPLFVAFPATFLS